MNIYSGHRSLLVMLIGAALSAWILCGVACAESGQFEASIDREKVAIGDMAQLGLTFYGTQSMPAPDLGNPQGLEIRYVGPSTTMTVINGKVSSSITHRYSIQPLKTGKFQLGPYQYSHGGVDYVSNSVALESVEDKASARQAPADEPLTATPADLENKIFLTLRLGKAEAYVNELVPATVKLYVNNLNVRDIQLPTFSQEGFSKAEFKEPKQYREELGGILYDVLEFKTHIFATRPGEYRLGPAGIKCNVMVKKRVQRGLRNVDDYFSNDANDQFFNDFFARYERQPLELKSQDVPFTVAALPEEGRPQDFMGAVGDFQFIFDANPKKVKLGDPITLRMELNGKGNFNTVLVPRLDKADGFRVYEPQIRTGENTKAFTQVVIPEVDTLKATPRAVFSYFDPYKKVYKTISQGPAQIEVERSKEEPAQVVNPIPPVSTGSVVRPQEEDRVARDIIYVKETIGRTRQVGFSVYEIGIVRWSLLAYIIACIVAFIIGVRRQRMRGDTAFSGKVLAIKTSRAHIHKLKRYVRGHDVKAFYETLFDALQDYLGHRLHKPREGVTFSEVEVVLRSLGVDVEVVHMAERLFSTCDRARFAATEASDFHMKDDLMDLESIIKYLERKKL